MGTDREQVGLVRYPREARSPQHFFGHAAGKVLEIELNVLDESRKVGDDQDALFLVLPHEGQDLGVLRAQQPERAAAKGAKATFASVISRLTHQSSDEGFPCCASTFTVS